MQNKKCSCKNYIASYDPFCKLHGSLFGNKEQLIIEPLEINGFCTCKDYIVNYDPFCINHGSIKNLNFQNV